MRKIPLIVATAAVTLSTPAYADWFGMVSDTDSGVRQTMLMGYVGEGDEQQSLVLLCTVAQGIRPTFNVSASLPPTREYVVRSGDATVIDVTMGDRQWTIDAEVETNSSSAFFAGASTSTARDIASAMEESPAEMTVSITADPIDITYSINTDNLDTRAKEWMDGCGR